MKVKNSVGREMEITREDYDRLSAIGLRLTIIEEKVEAKPSDTVACDICGKLCKPGIGLSAHKRSHK
jgi:hypothetical protein